MPLLCTFQNSSRVTTAREGIYLPPPPKMLDQGLVLWTSPCCKQGSSIAATSMQSNLLITWPVSHVFPVAHFSRSSVNTTHCSLNDRRRFLATRTRVQQSVAIDYFRSASINGSQNAISINALSHLHLVFSVLCPLCFVHRPCFPIFLAQLSQAATVDDRDHSQRLLFCRLNQNPRLVKVSELVSAGVGATNKELQK